MIKLQYISILWIAFFFSNSSIAQCVTNPNNVYSFTFQLSQYELVKENKSWLNARNCAINRGGGLAIIETQTEQDTIFHYLNQAGIINSNTTAPDGGGAAYVWLAGNDRSVEGNWMWDVTNTTNIQFWQGARNGNPVGGRYNNWGNEPDDYQGQDALGIALSSWPYGVAGEWNDVDETNNLYFLIEKPLLTALEEIKVKSEIKVYPNPVYEKLFISGTDGLNGMIKVFNSSSQLVAIESLGSNYIDVSHFSTGLYYLQIEGVHYRLPFFKK